MGERIPVDRGDWRPGDQRIYVSNIQKAEKNWAGGRKWVSVKDPAPV